METSGNGMPAKGNGSVISRSTHLKDRYATVLAILFTCSGQGVILKKELSDDESGH